METSDTMAAQLLQAYLERQRDFPGWSLARANLRGAYLARVNLADADLRGADLEGADLTGADLTGARLAGANLRGVNLKGANLQGAGLQDVDIDGADLTGADLSRTPWETELPPGALFHGELLPEPLASTEAQPAGWVEEPAEWPRQAERSTDDWLPTEDSSEDVERTSTVEWTAGWIHLPPEEEEAPELEEEPTGAIPESPLPDLEEARANDLYGA